MPDVTDTQIELPYKIAYHVTSYKNSSVSARYYCISGKCDVPTAIGLHSVRLSVLLDQTG